MAEERQFRRKPKKKVCAFCVDKVEEIDYKDIAKLRRYVSERAKILPRRISGNCDKVHKLLEYTDAENASNTSSNSEANEGKISEANKGKHSVLNPSKLPESDESKHSVLNASNHSVVTSNIIPDVADPWYTGNFEKAYSDILRGCRGLLKKL